MSSTRKYILLHDTPQLKKGKIVTLDCSDDRYRSLEGRHRDQRKVSFSRDAVEEMPYWFERSRD